MCRIPARAAFALLLALLTLPAAAAGQTVTGDNPTGDTESPSAGEAAPPRECCLVLLLPVGARAVSLGQTMVARTAPAGAFANPAGLARLEGTFALVHHASTIAGQANAVSLLFTPASVVTIGVSYLLIDHGEIATTDVNGVRTGALSLRDHLAVASIASHLAAGLTAGVNAKFYSFRVSCTGQCESHELATSARALDFGLQYRPEWFSALRFGAAVSNFGATLDDYNADDRDPLPTRIHAGAAYQLLRHIVSAREVALWLGFEAVGRWDRPRNLRVSFGAELAASDVLFLRAGYVPGHHVDSGTAVGVGLKYNEFRLAVAKTLGGGMIESGTEPFQVTFTMRL